MIGDVAAIPQPAEIPDGAQICLQHSKDIMCASCTPTPGEVYLAYYAYEGEMPG